LNPYFLLAHRNRYSEGTEDGQKTTRGHPNTNSYVKNLRVWYSRQTDRQTDRRTEKLIRCGLGNLLVPPGSWCDYLYLYGAMFFLPRDILQNTILQPNQTPNPIGILLLTMPCHLWPGGGMHKMRVRYTACHKHSLLISAEHFEREHGWMLCRATEVLSISHLLLLKWNKEQATNLSPITTRRTGQARRRHSSMAL
jgi:hypothetical protein